MAKSQQMEEVGGYAIIGILSSRGRGRQAQQTKRPCSSTDASRRISILRAQETKTWRGNGASHDQQGTLFESNYGGSARGDLHREAVAHESSLVPCAGGNGS